MNTISGSQAPMALQQLFSQGMPGKGGGMPMPPMMSGSGSSAMQSVKGADGQSLIDIREDLQSAVQDAVQGFDGSGDLKAEVQSAIQSTLEENGFDVDEVKNAMESSFGASTMSFDPASMLMNSGGPSRALGGGMGESFVQSFLEQFRAGANLDLEF